MKDPDFRPAATATLRWLPPTEGGRRSVPPGPIFAATALVGEQPQAPHVSIVIRYREEVPRFDVQFDADIAFLAPELVKDVLARGVQIAVMEGPRRVAEGHVTHVLSEAG